MKYFWDNHFHQAARRRISLAEVEITIIFSHLLFVFSLQGVRGYLSETGKLIKRRGIRDWSEGHEMGDLIEVRKRIKEAAGQIKE